MLQGKRDRRQGTGEKWNKGQGHKDQETREKGKGQGSWTRERGRNKGKAQGTRDKRQRSKDKDKGKRTRDKLKSTRYIQGISYRKVECRERTNYCIIGEEEIQGAAMFSEAGDVSIAT